jgi:phage terminase large subunit-like protein
MGPWIGAFLDEADVFPNGAHDDQIDAVSGAVKFLSSSGYAPSVYAGMVR